MAQKYPQPPEDDAEVVAGDGEDGAAEALVERETIGAEDMALLIEDKPLPPIEKVAPPPPPEPEPEQASIVDKLWNLFS